LPRTTGLRYSLSKLSKNDGENGLQQASRITTVYDLTIGLEGLPSPETVPETVFTLRSIFIDGRAPPKVHVHLRRRSVPAPEVLNDEALFGKWMNTVWSEKDELLSQFHQTGHFPDELARGAVESSISLSRTWTAQKTGSGPAKTFHGRQSHVFSDLAKVWMFYLPLLGMFRFRHKS
jgi:hypothetical protein